MLSIKSGDLIFLVYRCRWKPYVKKIKLFSAIACVDDLNGIGYKNQLLFKIPEDLKNFSVITKSYGNMIMGRKTFESLPKVLPDRMHYVLTKDSSRCSPHPSVKFVSCYEDLFELDRAIVIGGSSIYKLFRPNLKRLYLTHVQECAKECDSNFLEDYSSEYEIFYTNKLCKYKNNDVIFKVYERIKSDV